MIETAIIIGVVVGVSEIFKQFISAKYIPIVALILGVIASIGLYATGNTEATNWGIAVFNGVVIGLSACGLYSGGKTLVGK